MNLTENVLRRYDDFNVTEGTAMYSWVKQEKFKGMWNFRIAGFSSPFCGYSVNNDYSEHWTAAGNPKDSARNISEEKLRLNPFFQLTTDSRFAYFLRELTNYKNLENKEVDAHDIYANVLLSKKIKQTPLENYYKENDIMYNVEIKIKE